MKPLKRAGMVLGLLLVASLIASSLLAISDQVKKSEAPPPAALSGLGCGGGCGDPGEGGGCAGAKAIAMMGEGAKAGAGCGHHGTEAKQANTQHECPKVAKGEKCDPKTCADCTKQGCPIKAEGGECNSTTCADCPHAKAAAKPASHDDCNIHHDKATVKPTTKPADKS